MIDATDTMADRALEVLLEAGVLREPVDPFGARSAMRDALEAVLPESDPYRRSDEMNPPFAVSDAVSAAELIRRSGERRRKIAPPGYYSSVREVE